MLMSEPEQENSNIREFQSKYRDDDSDDISYNHDGKLWMALRNEIDSGWQKTKKSALRNLLETEMFIRIANQ